MAYSKVYLGETPDYERSCEHRGSGSARALHVSAQRVAWGILLGDRLGIDLDEEVPKLLSKHGDHFAAHLAAAFARKAQGRNADARVHLERARDLVEPEHRWSALVPTDAAWEGKEKPPTLSEDVPGRVYRVAADNLAPGKVFASRGVGRFIRMRSGELVYVNPVPLTDELGERIRALGDVTHIVLPAKYHSDHALRAKQLFPKARLFGVPAQRDYPSLAHVPFDGFLSDDAPLFPGELDQVTMEGVDVGDVWFVDRASRTLLVTDALFVTRLEGAEEFETPFGLFYNWAWGVHDRVGIPSYQPAMWSDIVRYQASLRRALALDFDHVGSCHGSFRGIEGGAKEKVRERLAWVLELGRFGALRYLGDFVGRHPVVFYKFAKEQIAARKAASATRSGAPRPAAAE